MALDQSALLTLLDALRSSESGDLVRSLAERLLQELIEAEASAHIGAGPHERSETRTNQRNGHRPKTLTTAAGDLDLRIPKVRVGSFFPSLLERRRRIDRALLAPANFKGPHQAAMLGPLGRLRTAKPSGADLLDLAPDNAVLQLAGFRRVFEEALLPMLSTRIGDWVLGPTFAGSRLVGGADGDLAAAGLLLDLKTSVKFGLSKVDMLQLIAYALLGHDDALSLDSVALFSARYAHFASWSLAELLPELANSPAPVPTLREEFRSFLMDHQSTRP